MDLESVLKKCLISMFNAYTTIIKTKLKNKKLGDLNDIHI